VAVCPADVSTRSKLATLLEQVEKPEEAWLHWRAILVRDPNNLKAREGVARCQQLTPGLASPTGEGGSSVAMVCGTLDRIEEDIIGTRWIYVKASDLDKTVVRVRVRVGRQTEVVRGKQQIDFSEVYIREFAEVSYHHIHDGVLEADTIYVLPECDPAT
jgi:hypothetical protein